MSLAIGAKLGPYEITGKLGAGGMGEVYKAFDARLGRTVAIKVSTEDFNPRFEREARAVAALNHPNICQLYDVGPNYLVLEHIDGAPIAPTESVRKLLDLAVQIADGMSAAHAAGFIHRDLKPSNVFVTREGRVKILDFGLAKNIEAQAGAAAPTITSSGLVAGTAAYMSPEQVRGSAEIDARSDQFSFGLVLYEMATGKRAFERESGVETLMAVLRDEAEPLPAKLPAPLRWIIERCLEKEAEHRYESSRDLYLELRRLRDRLADATTTHEAMAPIPARRTRLWLPLVTFAVGVAVAASAVALLGLRQSPPAPNLQFKPLSFEQGGQGNLVWSPDGRAVAFSASLRLNEPSQLYVRYLDSPVPTRLTQASGSPTQWTSTGQILFTSPGPPAGLWSISPVGGTPEVVQPGSGFEGLVGGPFSFAISRDGSTFAFLRGDDEGMLGLWTSSPIGAPPQRYEPAPFASRGYVNFPFVQFSPDGKQLLISWNPTTGEQLWLMPYPPDPAHPPRRVLENLPAVGSQQFSWMPDNRHIVISTDAGDAPAPRQLYVADTRSGQFRLLSSGTTPQLFPDVSPDGSKLVFMELIEDFDVVALDLGTAAVTPLIATDRSEEMPAWASAESALAYVTNRNGGNEIWLHEPGRGDRPVVTARDFSTPTRFFMGPALSHDGERVIYSRIATDTTYELWMSSVDGGAPQKLIEESGGRPGSWSPDGNSYVYQSPVGLGWDLMKVRTTGQAEPEVVASGLLGAITVPVWSPSGEWILHGNRGAKLISPDGQTVRDLNIGFALCAFARDAELLYCLRRETNGSDSLISIDFEGKIDRVIGSVPIEYRPSTLLTPALRLTLGPDGKSAAYATRTQSTNLWLIEGLDTVLLP